MANSRRNKFERFMKAVHNAGRKCFPEGSHEMEFIDEGILLMKDLMKGTPVFDENKETQKDVIDRKCEEFCKSMSDIGAGVSIKVVFKD